MISLKNQMASSLIFTMDSYKYPSQNELNKAYLSLRSKRFRAS